jgi:hypothetical protein
MGKRPHIYSRIGFPRVLVIEFFHCVVHVSLTYVSVNLLCRYAVQILYVIFAFIDNFVVLVSVFNFTSFLVFCVLHYQCLLHKWQLPVTLLKLRGQHCWIATMHSVTLEDASNWSNFLSVSLLIGQLISCSKRAILLGNCGCTVMSSFLCVRSPIQYKCFFKSNDDFELRCQTWKTFSLNAAKNLHCTASVFFEDVWPCKLFQLSGSCRFQDAVVKLCGTADAHAWTPQMQLVALF